MCLKNLIGLLATFALTFICSCKKKAPPVASITIIKPVKNSLMIEDSSLTIEVSHYDVNQKIHKVEFYFDKQYLGSDIYAPFEFNKSNIPINPGMHIINVKALDQNNEILCTDSIAFKSYEVRSKYFGNFNFKVHLTSYGAVFPAKDSIYYYHGLVKAFEYIDYNDYYFNKIWTNTYHNRLLTIYFSKNLNILSEVRENGVIDDTNLPPHNSQNGQFSDENNLYFKISSGGLGGGYVYEVNASRL